MRAFLSLPNAFILMFVIGLFAADRYGVQQAEKSLQSSCPTHIAYDKSGDPYCVSGSRGGAVFARP